eukprot:TRINITY_DN1087_c0_g1_i11.p1 TRINITY_DN1087_c0_g1~~TRINITY_DN1087_c0_g1_i11.p1  ORF type:complete len:245 (-),score=123.01 TRINITY_DN1087_c0_g1_i11:72-722(-)
MCIRDSFETTLKLLVESASASPQDKNKVILLRNNLLTFVKSEDHIKVVADWYEGKNEQLKNVELGLQGKWSIITHICRSERLTRDEKLRYLERQCAEDTSDEARYNRKRCEAIFATDDERKALWAYFNDKDNKDSVHLIESSIQGFNDLVNVSRNEQYYQEFLRLVIPIFTTRNKEFANAYIKLFPAHDRLDSILSDIQKLLAECPANQELSLIHI